MVVVPPTLYKWLSILDESSSQGGVRLDTTACDELYHLLQEYKTCLCNKEK